MNELSGKSNVNADVASRWATDKPDEDWDPFPPFLDPAEKSQDKLSILCVHCNNPPDKLLVAVARTKRKSNSEPSIDVLKMVLKSQQDFESTSAAVKNVMMSKRP